MCIETPKEEKDLKRVLQVITSCVGEIRSVSVFRPNLLQDELQNVKSRKSDEWDLESTGFRLYNNLCERGIQSEVEECIHEQHADMMLFSDVSDDSSLPLHEMEIDRSNLVRRIFLPLLSTLASCLKDVDEISESKQTETSTCNRSKMKRPNAPIGLLSLSNYTDVACLLELTVCTSILPLLERHVQRSTTDRRKHISKAIAGRLNAKSLDWGLDTLQYKIINKGESSLASRQKEAGEKIDRASLELSRTLVSICSVVLLDRFRPMLLPRLATDIYAVLFQLERLKDIRETIGSVNKPSQPTAFKTMLIHDMAILKKIFLHDNSTDMNTQETAQNKFAACAPIDFHTMAKAYQHLLHSGKHAPPWLKLRLGNLLTILAKSSQEGLIAIIDVFVLAASSLPAEEMTGASARLGRALCSKRIEFDCSINHEAYFKELLGQFATLLERRGTHSNDFSNNHEVNTQMTACIITTWAVFENVPPNILKSFFSNRLIEGLALSTDETSVQFAIRRLHSLLMFPPVGGKAVVIFCETLISEMKIDSRGVCSAPGMVTPLGQMIRVGCSTTETLLQCSTVLEATDTVAMAIQAILETLKIDSLNKDLAIGLVQSVATNSFDMLGYYFQRVGNQNTNDGCLILSHRDGNEYSNSLIDDMQRRAIFVVDRISTLALRSQQKSSSDSDREKCSNTTISALPSTIFLLLLSIYFESTKKGRSKFLPIFMSNHPDVYKIVSMIILPSLCEKCPPGTLLEEMSGSDESLLMHIISLILTSTANTVNHSNLDDTDSIHQEAEINICDFSDCCFKSQKPIEVNLNKSNIEVDISSQLSISSVVLSLLVAMLELGSKRRTEKEEKSLQLLLPYLNRLSALHENTHVLSSRDQRSDDEISAILKTELAEMASHAVALIQMRSLDTVQIPHHTRGDCIRSNISYIKTQLSSEQPPIRARAIVQLRHIVRCDLRDVKERNDRSTKDKNPLIIEMTCSKTPSERLPNPFFEAIEDMLSVCVLSLEDAESYVFSASIQTIVVIVDESSPDYCLPLLMNAISNGSLVLMYGTLCSSEFSSDSKLSSGQRIKLTEAMNFIIRRRGMNIRKHANLLMSMALFGTKSLSSGPATYDTNLQHEVRIQTETYFEGRGIEGARVEDSNNNCLLDRTIRAKTGGPVYDTELDDAVRASLISIISELISTSVLQPKLLAHYCPTLVQLGINAMALDSSRLFRRAVALMCRELYACAVREAEQEGSEMNFIISLLSSGEGSLEATLRFHTTSKTSATHIIADSATTARCTEALYFRDILNENGIISAGNAILELKKKNESDPIAKLLSKETKKKLEFSIE